MRNIAASVRARLGIQARAEGVTLDFLIERFAIGRLLWRISLSPHADQFILKGAQLFSVWEDNPHRPTRDIDFLSFGDSSLAAIEAFFTQLLLLPADPEDGLKWGNIEVAPIREDQLYGGVRVKAPLSLAGAQAKIQIDVGFGDVITPCPEELYWTELLGYPEARLLTYPPETVIAEKLEAAVQLEMDNSRMKDFYDLHWLSKSREFDFGILQSAIIATFERRGTRLPLVIPLALTESFSSDSTKLTQWKAFIRKNQLEPTSLSDVIKQLHIFLAPILLETPPSDGMSWNQKTGWAKKIP